MKTAVVTNWKTTTAAVLAALASVLTNVGALMDSDPLTLADWSLTAPLVLLAVGLLFAGDAKPEVA